jgi:hypothetical protein
MQKGPAAMLAEILIVWMLVIPVAVIAATGLIGAGRRKQHQARVDVRRKPFGNNPARGTHLDAR